MLTLAFLLVILYVQKTVVAKRSSRVKIEWVHPKMNSEVCDVWCWNSLSDFLPAALIKFFNVSPVISLKSIKKQRTGDFIVAVQITEETALLWWNEILIIGAFESHKTSQCHHITVLLLSASAAVHTRHRKHLPQKNTNAGARRRKRLADNLFKLTEPNRVWNESHLFIILQHWHPIWPAVCGGGAVGGHKERNVQSNANNVYACIVRGSWHFALVPAEGKVS